jgi:hypothetical protein
MYIDPGDYLPLMGVSMLAITTGFSIVGAWAMGRNRGLRDSQELRDNELDSRARIERMEKTLESVSEEIERLGEVQRFALKVIADKVSEAEPQEPIRLPHGRVITPH